MERGRECVERNRSERAKIAKVAEWKPPASPEARCALAETDNLEPPCEAAGSLRTLDGGTVKR